MKTSSKRKKFYLIAFIFLSLFICVESCLPSGISSFQSQLIAIIFNKGQRGDKEVLPTSLTIVGNETMKIGDSQQLKVNFAPEKVSDTRVTWSMGTTDIASLSSSGVVRALKEGTINIRATSNVDANVFGTFTISIEPVDLERLIINYNKQEVSVGTTASFGIQAGTCHIYAKSKYYDVESDRIEVTVNSNPVIPVTEINYSDIEEPIFVTQSLEINPTFNENATDQSFYMKSSDPSVLDVSGNRAIGKAEGSAYLTIISNTDDNMKSRDILVQVREVNAVEIVIYEINYYYQRLQPILFRFVSENQKYKVTNQKVSFTVDDSNICEVDENGNLYGKEIGRVQLTIIWEKDSSIRVTKEINILTSKNSLWGKINRFTRKVIGHFSLFLITGVFGMLALVAYKDKLRYLYSFLINISYGFVLGGISELLQLIPKGRACQFKDVIIDTLGYFFGGLLVWSILSLRNRKNKRIEYKNVPKE